MSRGSGHGSEERQLVVVFNAPALFFLISNSICSLLAPLISGTESLWLTPPSPPLSFLLCSFLLKHSHADSRPTWIRTPTKLCTIRRHPERELEYIYALTNRQSYEKSYFRCNRNTVICTETDH